MKQVAFWITIVGLAVSLTGRAAEAQVRFESEYLLWTRNNDADAPIITGPGGFSADLADFGYASGYRFTLGASLSYFDVEASFSSIPDWSDSTGGFLTLPLVFDDPSNPNIAPANGLGFVNALALAAGVPGLEDNEIEHLLPGALLQSRYESSFDSFELNVGSNRVVRPVFFALGWRHLELKENAATLILGDFQAIDADNGAFPGAVGDEPNNGLSHAALTGAGFALVSGAGDGFAGYDPTLVAPVITTLGIMYQGVTRNDLDGGQLTVGGRYAASDIVALQGFLKGGVYHNRALGIVRETVLGVANDTSVYQRTFRDRATTASFAGAVGFDVIVAVTDYVNFTLGYEALFVTDMALAADQQSGITTDLFGIPRYDVVHDSLFIAHGASVGLELNW